MANKASSGGETARGGAPSGTEPEAELHRLVSQHYEDVFRYAYRLSGNHADAEDLTQQTFVVAQAKLYQLREQEKASHWLFAVLRNCFLKSVRRIRPVSIDTHNLVFDDAQAARREAQVINQEVLQKALRELPDDFRLILLMYYFDELSYKEIAHQLGIPMGTVMSRLARAKLRLRDQLTLEPAERKLTDTVRRG